MGRCKSTNLCLYCQGLYVRETVEMLVLDAVEDAPSVWCVLTAREHLTRAQLSEHLRMVAQRLRREGWSMEWFVEVEFQKRGALHANLLVKGIAPGSERAWWARVVQLWCARVDAEPVGQWLGAVGAAEAVAKYLGKVLGHGLKSEQAPPIGWRGHRTSHTRGYFTAGTPAARARARQSLAYKRALAHALAAGLDAHDAELGVRDAMATAAQTTWVLATSAGARVSSARTPQGGAMAPLRRYGAALRAGQVGAARRPPTRKHPRGRRDPASRVRDRAADGSQSA